MSSEAARVAVVTGAAGGLGSVVARTLSARGDLVVAVDVNEPLLRNAVDGLAHVDTVRADLGEWDECDRLVPDLVARYGRVDILVNCAAVLQRTELDAVTPEVFARVFNVNCRAVFVLTRAAVGDMERRRWGRIVNVTSIGVHTGGYSITSALYEATKGAVMSFTKTFARYAAPRGILINSVAPGGMRTQMLTQQTPADVLEAVERDIPVGRLAEPEEVAGVVAYLTGVENTYAVGATFDVNGGAAMP